MENNVGLNEVMIVEHVRIQTLDCFDPVEIAFTSEESRALAVCVLLFMQFAEQHGPEDTLCGLKLEDLAKDIKQVTGKFSGRLERKNA